MPKITFEECIDIINNEINKRRGKWNLKFLTWIDFDDVAQIIRIHIYEKWHQYNEEKPLTPWLNVIISNQIKNIIRNVYGNYSRPCLKCAASEDGDNCRIYGKQSSDCPLYATWEKSKKNAHNIKLPVSLDVHSKDVYELKTEYVCFDIKKTADNLHRKMKEELKPFEWRVYKMLYIDNIPEDKAARNMGYKTTEKGRQPGYKQLKNIRKSILMKVKRLLDNDEIDIEQ